MDKQQEEKYLRSTFQKRLFFIMLFFVLLLGMLIYRLFYFQILKHKEYLAKSQAQQQKVISLPANRGNIYDRNHNLYAASIDSYSMYANPRITSLTSEQVILLSRLTGISTKRIATAVTKKLGFVWLRRKLSKEDREKFFKLSYKGIYFAFDKHRKPYVYVNPLIIKEKQRYARFLSDNLDVSYEKTLKNLNKIKTFFTVKKNISDEELALIKQKTFYGIELLREDKRIYLKNKRASHILGYVGIDNQGLSGIEYEYDKEMRGKAGKLIVENDRKGNEIYTHTKQLQLPSIGKNIHLTIDNYIQYVAESELSKAISEYKAQGGMVVIMDPRNGDVLAMSSYPGYNPNRFHKYSDTDLLNNAISSVYEPGSTMKVITIASALDEGIINTKTRVSCPASIKVGGRVIRESHTDKKDKNKVKILTPMEIIRDSVNVGTVKIGLKLGHKKLYHKLRDFGFGMRSGIDLPGESVGILKKYDKWWDSDKAIITFGHSVSVTALQMINSIAAICNDGVLLKPKIVKKVTSNDNQYVHTVRSKTKRRVISSKTAEIMRDMMREVVIDGTATLAEMPGYSVFGKTGTAQKIDSVKGGYKKGSYVTSFIGGLPKDNPRLVALVVIDDPQKNKYASTTAVPVFRRIMEKIVNYLVIPPDEKEISEVAKLNK